MDTKAIITQLTEIDPGDPALQASGVYEFVSGQFKSGKRFLEESFDAIELENKAIQLSDEEWDGIAAQFSKKIPASAYSAIVNNVCAGMIFANVPKATGTAGKPALTRAKVYEKFGVSARAAADYARMAEHGELVMGTIKYALDSGEPISQSRIIDLLDAHQVLKGALNFTASYLQVYERILVENGGRYADSPAGKGVTYAYEPDENVNNYGGAPAVNG